jgi:Leucine rich repeat N-terminal domain
MYLTGATARTTGRRPLRSRCTRTALALLVLVGATTHAPTAAAQTIDNDKAALLTFKASVSDPGGLLSSWTEDTDPCVDDWAGIKCNCFPFFEDNTLAERPEVRQSSARNV